VADAAGVVATSSVNANAAKRENSAGFQAAPSGMPAGNLRYDAAAIRKRSDLSLRVILSEAKDPCNRR
jgi:hypothetical protein